jgi:aminoglycoside phosphotransferase (APT) family kinase protein
MFADPTSEREAFAALVRCIDPGAALLRTRELKGGVSARVTALELAHADGRVERLVVRRHGAADLARNPRLAADEFRLLETLDSAGVPVPRPRYLDAYAELFPVPCLVVEYVDGEPGPPPGKTPDIVGRFAELLAAIHRVDPATVAFLPERRLAAEKPAPRPDEHRIREVLAAALPRPGGNRPVLLHGDFWPGNTLWQDGRLLAVLDWEDAAIGDPLADVANARLELHWALGSEAMEEFTRRYADSREVDLTDLPYWDLWADLRLAGRIGEWGLDDAAETAMRAAHLDFVARAFAMLSLRW